MFDNPSLAHGTQGFVSIDSSTAHHRSRPVFVKAISHDRIAGNPPFCVQSALSEYSGA
jgi:hypothetical protein